MKISVTNIPKKITRKLIIKALEFYAKKLISTQLNQNLTIHVKFALSTNVKGYSRLGGFVEIEDYDNPLPREFTITVYPEQSVSNILKTLAHEFVHIKQYAKGEMKDLVRYPNKVRFRKEIYSTDGDQNSTELYWFAPWEIEAYGLEPGLYNLFLQDLKHKYESMKNVN